MTDVELRKVCRWINDGGNLFITTDSDNNQHLKVIHGPLGMFVHRFAVDENDLVNLRNKLAKDSKFRAA
jgi:hypothetical protein